MRVQRLFLFFLLVGSSNLWAQQDCKPVDLRKDFGAVRNQQSTGWCYAFSLADVLGHKLGIRPPAKLSARDVATTLVSFNANDALTLNAEDKEALAKRVEGYDGFRLDRRSGAHPIEAFKAYANRGRMCLESQLPSQSAKYSDQWLNKRVDEFYENLGLEAAAPQGVPTSEDDIIKCYLANGFTENATEIKKITHNWATDSLRREADSICPKTDKMEGLSPTQKFLSEDVKQEDLMEMGMSALDNNQPFIVDYDVGNWKNPIKIKIETGTDEPTYLYQPTSGGRHASVVVGRRWNGKTNQCEVLIRNSWGTSCGYYREDVECEDGNFWVSAKELFEKSHSVFKF